MYRSSTVSFQTLYLGVSTTFLGFSYYSIYLMNHMNQYISKLLHDKPGIIATLHDPQFWGAIEKLLSKSKFNFSIYKGLSPHLIQSVGLYNDKLLAWNTTSTNRPPYTKAYINFHEHLLSSFI